VTDDEQAIRATITKRLTWQSHHMVGMNPVKRCWMGFNTTFLTLYSLM
jgi:hypothetical protein